MKRNITLSFIIILFVTGANVRQIYAQKPYRVGTTTANFLEIGYGSAGISMGDAFVSVVNDISSIYWNPAGLSYMRHSEAQFMYQPWLVETNTAFIGVGLVLPSLGTFALGVIQANYGEMEVNTLEMQNGTGELFSANDYAVSFSYARKLAQWFSFGASMKYVSSQIWHSNANAMAIDLGVIVNTSFFSPTGEKNDGLNIGMSISNYGTKMKFDGVDLLHPIDILPNQAGNYRDVRGKFDLESWELPLIFRIGISLNPIVTDQHIITMAFDALHPNNNSESINVGLQYQLKIPSAGNFFLRGGYKSLFINDANSSQYGLTFGAGMELHMMNNLGTKLEYSYRGVGILGKTQSYTFSFLF